MKKEKIDEASGKQKYMRSFMNFGFPLNINGVKYKNVGDRQSEQKKFIGDYQSDLVNYLKETFGESNIKPYLFSQAVAEE
jgi:hypothetical protein